MRRIPVLSATLMLCALTAAAQTGTAPVLSKMPDAPYPAQAFAAHIAGEAVVAFSIDLSGQPVRVHAVSGPDSLTHPLEAEIRSWRFVIPLPRDAEKDFVADYTYSIVEPEQPAARGGGPNDEHDTVPGPIAAVSGTVRSVRNWQVIDATPSVRQTNGTASAWLAEQRSR